MARILALLLLLGFLGCAGLAAPSLAQELPGPTPGRFIAPRFIALSDIHLDPMASGTTQSLADAEPDSWAAILDRVPPDRGRYGEDATWPLLRGALDAMREAEPHPAFLLLTGDLLAHRYRARFAASGVRDAGPAAYGAFVRKTVAFVAGEVARRFPGVPAFPALGNDDSDCGDYGLVPGGAFLRDTLPLARGLIGLPEGTPFDRDWVGGLGYAVANPTLPGVRVVFLNSVLLSHHYRQGCGPARDPEAGEAALDWLERRLDESRQAGEKVWLVMHIPPGADAFATRQAGVCAGNPVSLWKPAHTRRFLALGARHAGTIAAAFAGHTHMDEFRLLGEPDVRGVVLGTPGLSPIYGQNPGFHVYAYAASGALQDRETWYLANLAQAGPLSPPAWRREYGFRALWGVPALDPPALAALGARIEADDPQARADWTLTYPVGRPAMWREPLTPAAFRAYACAIGHVAPEDYRSCLCGAGSR